MISLSCSVIIPLEIRVGGRLLPPDLQEQKLMLLSWTREQEATDQKQLAPLD